ELGLEIGVKAGERVDLDIDRLNAVAVALHSNAVLFGRNVGSRRLNGIEGALKMFGAAAAEQDVTAGHGDGHGEGAGFDAVGDDFDGCAMEAGHAFDGERASADAADLGAHRDQTTRDVVDLG